MRLCTHWDLDGCASQIVLTKILDFDSTYACGYSKFDKFIKSIRKDEVVIFSDVSLTQGQVRDVLRVTEKFYIIDHHPDTEILANLYPEKVFFSLDHCGAELCRQLVAEKYPEKYKSRWNIDLDMLVKLTNIYDLWITDDKIWQHAYNLNLLYWHYSHYSFAKKFRNGYVRSEENNNIIKNLLLKKSELIKDAELHDIGDKVLFVLCDREVINDFTLIYKKKYDLYFILSASYGEFTLSVRSTRDDKHVGDILNILAFCDGRVVKAGGHEKAGGVSFIKDINVEEITKVCQVIVEEYENFSNTDYRSTEVPF